MVVMTMELSTTMHGRRSELCEVSQTGCRG
jgi:hypothetical protein